LADRSSRRHLGRKTYVVRNLTTWRNDDKRERRRSVPAELDQIRELETENALLRARVADLVRQLEQPAALEPEDLSSAPDDGSMEAFDSFLSESDPQLDRTQRFLLG